MPGAAGRAAAAFAAAHWPQSPRLPRPLRLATIFDNLSRDAASAYYSDLCQVKPHVARRVMGLSPLRDPSASVVYDAVTAPYRRCASMHPVQRAMYADLHIYLPNDVLVKVDRMTMQHSIEVRCPLLDHRVIELAFRIPVSRKMPALRGKHLLRQLAQRRLPPGISKLPKHGFSAPVGEWIGGPCAGRFHDEVLSPGAAVRDLVDTSEIGRLFHDHVRGVANYTSALWTVWMLARWYAKAGEEAKRRAPDAGADRPIAGVPVTIA
jgi:asparagine synthase (glutamine-hydrolysing)